MSFEPGPEPPSMSYVGGAPPPDGDRNVGAVINACNWVVFAAAWIIVVLRSTSRIWLGHNFGWDDAAMILAQMANTVGMGLVMLEVEWGLGRHRYFAKEDHYVGFLKYNYLDWCQVFFTLAVSKIAICLFLLRISKFDKWRKFLFGVIAFLVLTHIPILFLYIFQCNPVSKAWNMQLPGTCFSLEAIENIIIIQGVCSILSDFVLAAFPIILIRNMRLPSRQKLALNLLMGLGALTAIVCIIRTVFSYEVKAKDLTWQGIPNALCRVFEINLGIIAACMPMMRPLWNHYKRKWRARFRGEKSGTTRTPMSRLQWYKAPPSLPWYRRVRRHFQFPLRPTISPTSSTQSMNRNETEHVEKVVLPPPHPEVKKAVVKSKWPQEYEPMGKASKRWDWVRGKGKAKVQDGGAKDDEERPPNATWAKDVDEPQMSLDLPLQGARTSEWNGEGEGEWEEFDFNVHRDVP